MGFISLAVTEKRKKKKEITEQLSFFGWFFSAAATCSDSYSLPLSLRASEAVERGAPQLRLGAPGGVTQSRSLSLSHFLTSQFTTCTQRIGPWAAAAAAASPSGFFLPASTTTNYSDLTHGLHLSECLLSDRLTVRWFRLRHKRSEPIEKCLFRRTKKLKALSFHRRAHWEQLVRGHHVRIGDFHTLRMDFGLLWQTRRVCEGLTFFWTPFSPRSCSLSSGFLQNSRVAEIPCSRQGWCSSSKLRKMIRVHSTRCVSVCPGCWVVMCFCVS